MRRGEYTSQMDERSLGGLLHYILDMHEKRKSQTDKCGIFSSSFRGFRAIFKHRWRAAKRFSFLASELPACATLWRPLDLQQGQGRGM